MTTDRIGPYRIERHIGSGGMGTVYLAWDDRLDRRVAIKSIHPSKELSEKRKERLRREAKAIAGINHPAITQVHDILTEGERDYIVMEYVEGRSLASHLIGKDKQLPLDRAIDIARQIAEGLEAAHDLGIIHRDLKADNVMIDLSGRVRILDFGLAKSLVRDEEQDSLTEDGMVMGTSCAMSPEQVLDHDVDERSDLFSLGSLLYKMITGQHPFQGTDKSETMRRVTKHRQAPPSRFRPDLPMELDLIVDQLLEKKRNKRPSTAREVSEALAALCVDSPTVTSDEASLNRITSEALRRRYARRTLATITTVITALVIIPGGLWMLNLSRRPPTLAVAVLESTVSEDVKDRLFVDAVQTSMVSAVASLEGLVAISPRSTRGLGDDPAKIAHAVSADSVLTSECTPHGNTWRIKMTAHSGPGIVAGVKILDVPGDRLEILIGAISSSVRELFPQHRPNTSRFTSTASRDDWETYFQIRQRVTYGLDYESALADYRDLRTRSPHFIEPILGEISIARYLYQLNNDVTFLEQGQAALRDARSLAPTDPRTHRATAELAFAEGDYARVEEAITAGSLSSPADYWITEYEAHLANAKGDTKWARKILMEFSSRRPSWRSLYMLADHDYHNGRPADALIAFERALTFAPGQRSILAKIAEVSLLHGDLHRTVSLYEKLEEEDPTGAFLSNLSLAHMLLGNVEEATEKARMALELDSSKGLGMLNYADCLWMQGEHEESQVWYRKAMERADELAQADGAEALTIRSQCLAHLGQHKEAAAVAQQRLRLAPNDMSSHFDAALVFAVIGDRISAVVSAQRAIELGLDSRWLELPWFDPLRSDPDFAELFAKTGS
ncbi:MAG: protein kinase [bacterium]|nr:protein kinase [bacterium]